LDIAEAGVSGKRRLHPSISRNHIRGDLTICPIEFIPS
jgi:hypothetical protein